MILSVLIPTYNHVCTDLVAALCRQAERVLPDFEILVADDASASDVREANAVIAGWKHCRFIALESNVGRARIRNILADNAKGDYFLFMDCDAVVVDYHFITRYVACIPLDKVVCGGIIHPATLPSSDVSLRYKYEKAAEKRFTAACRSSRPYAAFRSFNFMIERNVFMTHRFDESVKHYGFEDTLLGKALQVSGVPVRHIDNPLLNGDIETNPVYLRKVEESLRTLYEFSEDLKGHSPILALYARLEKFHLQNIVSWLFKVVYNPLYKNLMGHNPSLLLFAFFKLGCYCRKAVGTTKFFK